MSERKLCYYALTVYAMGDPRTNPDLCKATEEHAKSEAIKAGLEPVGDCEWERMDEAEGGRVHWLCKQPAYRSAEATE